MRTSGGLPTVRRLSRALTERLAKIELMIFDVDGVLTDGRLYYGMNGEVLKVFSFQRVSAIRNKLPNLPRPAARRQPCFGLRGCCQQILVGPFYL